METFIIRFPSVTYAQKAQKILEEEHIRSRLTRQGSRGCSYGLEIYWESPESIYSTLEKRGIIFLT